MPECLWRSRRNRNIDCMSQWLQSPHSHSPRLRPLSVVPHPNGKQSKPWPWMRQSNCPISMCAIFSVKMYAYTRLLILSTTATVNHVKAKPFPFERNQRWCRNEFENQTFSVFLECTLIEWEIFIIQWTLFAANIDCNYLQIVMTVSTDGETSNRGSWQIYALYRHSCIDWVNLGTETLQSHSLFTK